MDSAIENYQKSVLKYRKAKNLLNNAEQEKKHYFQSAVKILQPLVIQELIANQAIDSYYINGNGRVVIIDFFLKELSIDIMYGFLAEDDIFPNKTTTLKLYLFNF